MRPKARAIAEELEKHEGPLTADFQRVYGLRLVDTIIERTPSEIFDLILWLPSDSAFMACHRAKSPQEERSLFEWGMIHELILAQCNLQQQFNWMYAQAHSKSKITRPEPISGPLSEPSRTKQAGGDATAMARAFLAQARKG